MLLLNIGAIGLTVAALWLSVTLILNLVACISGFADDPTQENRRKYRIAFWYFFVWTSVAIGTLYTYGWPITWGR